MSWLDKLKEKTWIGKKLPKAKETWVECKKCLEQVFSSEVEQNLHVCPKCDYHFRIGPQERIYLTLDIDSFEEHDQNLSPADPLKFKDKKKYKDRIKSSVKPGESAEAIICGSGIIEGHPVQVCAFDFKFMGGSMGSVVGEKITRAIERAIQNKEALILFSCSGGARMQEGILSLMQMAKTSASLKKLAEHHLPYISILTDPTMGGVSASFAMLGDIILAEPGALIGFAGPRVIEQTIKQKLPEGFQTSEFLLNHGLIDNVIHRQNMRSEVGKLLSLLKNTPTAKPEPKEG